MMLPESSSLKMRKVLPGNSLLIHALKMCSPVILATRGQNVHSGIIALHAFHQSPHFHIERGRQFFQTNQADFLPAVFDLRDVASCDSCACGKLLLLDALLVSDLP